MSCKSVLSLSRPLSIMASWPALSFTRITHLPSNCGHRTWRRPTTTTPSHTHSPPSWELFQTATEMDWEGAEIVWKKCGRAQAGHATDTRDKPTDEMSMLAAKRGLPLMTSHNKFWCIRVTTSVILNGWILGQKYPKKVANVVFGSPLSCRRRLLKWTSRAIPNVTKLEHVMVQEILFWSGQITGSKRLLKVAWLLPKLPRLALLIFIT